MAKSYVTLNCVNCQQMKDIPEEDIQWLEERNLNLAVACRMCSKEIPLEDAKWLQERRLGLRLICRDCNESFIISPDELVWLLENDLKIFKRCESCRDINKVKKALAEEKAKQLEKEIFEVEGFEVVITPEQTFHEKLEAAETQEEINKVYDDQLLIENETVTDGGE